MSHRKLDVKRARQGLARLDALLETYPELREPDAQARLTAWLEEERRAMTDYAEKTRARVQRLRDKRKQAGWLQHELWLDPASAALIDRLKQPGESMGGVIQRALQALAQERTPARAVEGVTSNGAAQGDTSNAPIDMMDPRQRKVVLLERLSEMRASKLSLQKMADQLNREGVPTLSGEGQWHKKTISKLLKQAEDRSDRFGWKEGDITIHKPEDA